MSDRQMVVMGRISGLFGVQGWVKIFSHASPRERILDYSPWYIKINGAWEEHRLQAGKRQGKGVVAHLQGVDDRDLAAELVGADIAVKREQLPDLPADEFYWSDLQGMRVETSSGVDLGRVSYLFETGANDVMVVKGERERLIPFTQGEAVRRVDVQAGLIVVDWDPDF